MIRNKISQTQWLILIFCLGFILRLFFVLDSRNPTIKDGASYEAIAMSLINGKGYTLDGQHPTSQVPPLYPFFLASVYIIFGHNFKAALILQAVMGTITCLLLFYLAKEIFKDIKVAVICGIICAIYYYFIKEGQLLWTETIFMFLVVLSVLCYIKMINHRSLLYAIGTGFFLAASALTKPVSLFLLVVIVIVGFYQMRAWQQRNFLLYRRFISVVLVVFALPICLWAARNFVVQKQFVLVATGAGRNLYEAFNPYEGKKYGITVEDEVIKKGEVISSEVLRDRFYFKQGLKSIFNKSIGQLVKLTLLKGLTFWSLIDWGPMGNGAAVFNFCTSFILPFSFIAVILLRKDKQVLLPLLMPIIYFFLMSLVFIGLPRFRLSIEPFLLLLASYSIVRLFNRFSTKVIPLSCIFIWLGINLLLFLNSNYIKEYFKSLVSISGLW
jgi:4-amino-4-deoxy-L-arabinose transferase-like glycosyltransferase